MKRIIIGATILFMAASTAQGQEYMIDSIKSSQFIGVQQAGEGGQILYVPYFNANKADKNNFIIRQMNGMNLTEEAITRIEVPNSYSLRKSAFNGSVYFLMFFDETKKEDVILTVENSNVVKKMTFKQSNNTYLPFCINGNENFTLVTINSKGNFEIEMLNKNLESKWKKKYNADAGSSFDIIDISPSNMGLEIFRKINKGNNYSFNTIVIQPDNGEEVINTTISHSEFQPYPTFISEKDGMKFCGGFFFKNGVYSNTPDGVFFASMNPEGKMEQTLSVPYSQVIEDLKNSLGSKLSGSDVTIAFSGGTFSHETQTFSLTGHVISKTNVEGGAKITIGDIVTLKFNLQSNYLGATAIKSNNEVISIKGDLSSTKMLELGIWLSNANIMPFKFYTQLPGNPIFGYEQIAENKLANLCFRNSGIANDTLQPICVSITREPVKEQTYSYAGIPATGYPVMPYAVFTSQHEISHVTIYELHNNQLFLRKMQMPELQKLMIPMAPPAPDNIAEEPAPQGE